MRRHAQASRPAHLQQGRIVMSSINTISIDKLARLIGTPRCPVLIDVQTDEDFAADLRLIPGAIRRPWSQVSGWAKEFVGQSAIIICQKGQKLSEGVAAWLRHEGIPADSLDGGALAWAQAGLPMVPEIVLPPRDAQGRTVWVTRARPKVDRIACPWLISRFVDPGAVFLFVAASEVSSPASPHPLEATFESGTPEVPMHNESRMTRSGVH